MKEFCKKLLPADFIAGILIIGAMILKFKGADGVTTAILSAISFYYFGKRSDLFKSETK